MACLISSTTTAQALHGLTSRATQRAAAILVNSDCLRVNGKRKFSTDELGGVELHINKKRPTMENCGPEPSTLSPLDVEILERAARILNIPIDSLPTTLQALAEYSPLLSEGDEGSFDSEETENVSIPPYAWPAGLQDSGRNEQPPEFAFGLTSDWDVPSTSRNNAETLREWIPLPGEVDQFSFQDQATSQEWRVTLGSEQPDLFNPFDNLSEGGYVVVPNQQPNQQTSIQEETSARFATSYDPELRSFTATGTTGPLGDPEYFSAPETDWLGLACTSGIETSLWQSSPTVQGPNNVSGDGFPTLVEDSFLDNMVSTIRDTSTTSRIGIWQSFGIPQTRSTIPQSGSQQVIDHFLIETPATQAEKRQRNTARTLDKRRLQAFARNIGSGQQKRRPFQNQMDRVQTGRTRRLGACIRCRIQRIRCSDDQGICLKCQKVKNMRIPCLRLKLTDGCLFRTGSAPGYGRTKRWSNLQMDEISQWKSSTVKTIFLTQNLCDRVLKVQVKEFVPLPGDVLEREWADRQGGMMMKKKRSVPTYAIANMKATSFLIQQYVDKSVELLVRGLLYNSGPLIFQTYLMALKLSGTVETDDEKEFLRNVLRLWVAIRMTSPSMYVRGSETLGMKPEHDTSSPDFGKVPISPVMTAQVQLILYCTVLLPLRKKVLRHLNNFMTESEPRKWFTIYVGLFVLLHSCALVTKGAYDWARKRGDPNRYANKPLIEDLHMGAKIFLGHWHSCTKGKLLFDTSAEAGELKTAMNLTQEQIDFLAFTTSQIHANGVEMSKARLGHHYEHDLFFLSQLYDDEWVPVHTIV